MLHLGRWQGLDERVRDHVVGWAINEVQEALLNDLSDEVVVHVDVLCACVVLVVLSERDGCLVVREEGGRRFDGLEDFGEEAAQPQRLLHPVCHCGVFALSRGQGDCDELCSPLHTWPWETT
jgi:hypothetical protein